VGQSSVLHQGMRQTLAFTASGARPTHSPLSLGLYSFGLYVPLFQSRLLHRSHARRPSMTASANGYNEPKQGENVKPSTDSSHAKRPTVCVL
jgi:hypothetical protein